MSTHPVKAAMTGHLHEATDALAAFLTNPEDRVFVLKGPYGAGKSFFLRWFLKSNKGQQSAESLSFMSYVSVFGVDDLKELQNVMVGSITLRKLGDSSRWKTGIFDKSLTLLQKGISPLLGGLNLELSAGSVIWSIAMDKGMLLVIDDVDRKGTSLPLDSIIGFANSLAEHSDGRTKVIFVLNEEQFSDEDSALWSKLREKFIDSEFRFHPSPKELADLFLEDSSLRDLIGTIHSRLERPNIRSMRKIQSMVRRLKDYLTERDVHLDGNEIDHAVRCSTLYLQSGIQFKGEDLSKIHSKNWYVHESEPPNELEKAMYELMELIEFGPDSNLDPLFIGFFHNGTIEPDLLAAFIKNRLDEESRQRFEIANTELWKCVNENFRQNGDEFIERSESFLEAYRGNIGPQDLDAIIKYLNSLEKDTSDEWKLWLEARLPSMSSNAVRMLRQQLPDEVKPLLDGSAASSREVVDPTSVFKELLENDRFGMPETISELAKWSEEDFLQWFKDCDDKDLFSQLRAYLRINYEPGDLLTIRNTLAAALRRQASSSSFETYRVGRIFANLIQQGDKTES
jgi:hypothetical protein